MIDLDLDYAPDPRGVTTCSRCGALTRRGFHDCERFLALRARRRHADGCVLDDVTEIEDEIALRRFRRYLSRRPT